MFCNQCEQTAKGTGCTKVGVCGKQPDVAALQDLLIFALQGLSEVTVQARAKGLSELTVLFRHVLLNAMIPILTGVVVVIPLLFMGSLLTESFFGIPGLGSYTIDAINAQDFAVVRAMVFIGSVLYIIGLILTDLSYTLVDPRVSLQ